MSRSSIEQATGRTGTSTRPAWQMRALAVVVAIVVNLVILVVGTLVSGASPVADVGSGEQVIGFGQVIGITALVGLAAWGLLAVLERITARAATIWTVAGVVVLVLSLFGPLGSGVGIASKVILASMHIGAAAPVIALMRRTVAPRA